MMLSGTRVPSFDVANSRTTSASGNVTGELSYNAVRTAVPHSARYHAPGSRELETWNSTSWAAVRSTPSTDADVAGDGGSPSAFPFWSKMRTHDGPPIMSTTYRRVAVGTTSAIDARARSSAPVPGLWRTTT